MDQIEKKLSVAIQNVAELQARQFALEGVMTSLLAILLSDRPAPLAVLSILRGNFTVHASSSNANNDAEIVKLLTEQRVQDIIDKIETLLRQ